MKRITWIVIAMVALGFVVSKHCQGQQATSAQSAYEYVEEQRHDAEILWKQKNSRGVEILNHLLGYLNEPAVRELARGFFYLKKSLTDVHYDLSRAYALSGDKDQALSHLEQVVNEGGLGIDPDAVTKEPAFETMRQEPMYRRAVAQLIRQKKLWGYAGFYTPYKEDLSTEEKIAGLSDLWAEIKYNFVNFDRVPDLDWDKTYRTYLPRVIQTGSTAEYYRVLQEMTALLRDAHTSVDPPRQLLDQFYSTPPVVTGMVDGRVLILDVLSPTVERLGLQPGQEVLAIDGAPVKEYGATHIMPYQSSSTPQHLELKTYSYSLLSGPKGQAVRLTLKDAQNRVQELSVQRGQYTDLRNDTRLEFKELPGKIGYVKIKDFNDKEITKQFYAEFDTIARTSALIVDLRVNGGGSGDVAYNILATLTNKPFAIFQIRSKDYIGYFRSSENSPPSWSTQDAVPGGMWKPDDKHRYLKPIVVLVSAATGSSAEDFVTAFDTMKRGTIIGEPTAGSSGQPFYFLLPGGGTARVCTIRDRYPDGREFVGIGVQPNVLVHPTVAGVRDRRDEALEAALNYLREKAERLKAVVEPLEKSVYSLGAAEGLLLDQTHARWRGRYFAEKFDLGKLCC